MRIQKYLSEKGLASRREGEKLMLEGLVKVNGKVTRELGTQIDPEIDKVEIVTTSKVRLPSKTSIILYKPRGIVSSRIRSEGKTVFDLLPQFNDLNIIGRLDKESEGLLLLSDDGVIARAVTGQEHKVEKEYEVTTQEKISASKIRRLESNVPLSDGPTLPAKVKYIDENTFRITLKEGRNHQIRRMCEYIHVTVKRLIRLRIDEITLGRLKPGAFRELTPKEIASLKS